MPRKYSRLRPSNVNHGISRTHIYRLWGDMINRCYNPTNQAYHNYGGRGIKVCERWHNAANFAQDMGNAPIGKWLERRDNNKGYSPENCYWATVKQQQINRRSTRWIEFDGQRHNLREWSEITGIKERTIAARIDDCNWSIEKALTTPVKIRKEG